MGTSPRSAIPACRTFSSSASSGSPSSNPSSKASSSVPLPWEQLSVLSLLGKDSTLELYFPAEGLADRATDSLAGTTTNPVTTTPPTTTGTTPSSPRTTTPLDITAKATGRGKRWL